MTDTTQWRPAAGQIALIEPVEASPGSGVSLLAEPNHPQYVPAHLVVAALAFGEGLLSLRQQPRYRAARFALLEGFQYVQSVAGR